MPLSQRGSPENSWHRVFTGTVVGIQSAASWIESIASELGMSDPQAFAMQVCLEELMSNIVQHGRSPSTPWPQIDSKNPLSISVTVKTLADRITMTLEDNGRPFNVAQAPGKVIDQPLQNLQPGGLGIQLIKSFASNLEYSRTETGNRVILEFTG
jgi:serine/threonine-protein kinase RsbW